MQQTHFSEAKYLKICMDLIGTPSTSPRFHGITLLIQIAYQGFPGGSVVKNAPANARDTGSIPDAQSN